MLCPKDLPGPYFLNPEWFDSHFHQFVASYGIVNIQKHYPKSKSHCGIRVTINSTDTYKVIYHNLKKVRPRNAELYSIDANGDGEWSLNYKITCECTKSNFILIDEAR